MWKAQQMMKEGAAAAVIYTDVKVPGIINVTRLSNPLQQLAFLLYWMGLRQTADIAKWIFKNKFAC